MNFARFTFIALVIFQIAISYTQAQPIQAISSENLALPVAAHFDSKSPLDVSRLRQVRPAHYILEPGDTLGIFIEGVLGELDSNPPVQFPAPNSDLPPSIGYPTVIQTDGTIRLPLVSPISVEGMTLVQAEALVKRVYLDGDKPVVQHDNRIMVSLIRERTYRVTVIREDLASTNRNRLPIQATQRFDQSASGTVLNLPAYKNDVLNALTQTGGIPGLNAQPFITIIRGQALESSKRFQGASPFPRSNRKQSTSFETLPSNHGQRIQIPIRGPGVANVTPLQSILQDGDILKVSAKPTEVFYTGGLLGGQEIPIPRDTGLDVLAALAMAGGNFGAGSLNQGIAPSEVIILRNHPTQGTFNIRVDLNQAYSNPLLRPQIVAGDTLILRNTPSEQVIDFGIRAIDNFGIRRLVR